MNSSRMAEMRAGRFVGDAMVLLSQQSPDGVRVRPLQLAVMSQRLPPRKLRQQDGSEELRSPRRNGSSRAALVQSKSSGEWQACKIPMQKVSIEKHMEAGAAFVFRNCNGLPKSM